MDSKRALTFPARRTAANAALGCLFACAVVLTAALAVAQDASKAPAPEQPGFFTAVGRWFDQTADNFNASVRSVRERFQNLGHDAGVAARTTVDTAKDAADAVGRLPNARVITGHEKCQIAPNGAPDCIAAAYAICQAKGFKTGKSVDMTTAEVCPAQVYLAGRNSGPGCHTETFVSRALCQ
jgi:hypothetical protein